MTDVERYLSLFEDAIREQAKVVGEKAALEQARKAGLGVSPAGHIVSCVGNPALVLLRLVRNFAEGGKSRSTRTVHAPDQRTRENSNRGRSARSLTLLLRSHLQKLELVASIVSAPLGALPA